MNKGLKSYTKLTKVQVGNTDIYVNLNKNDANLHIALPLITTIGICPIETKAIFNLLDQNSEGLFGKGFEINLYNRFFASNDDVIKVRNYDGTIDEYIKTDDYFFNKETQLKIRKVDSKGQYEVEDKYGNISRFDGKQNYLNETCFKNGYKIMAEFSENDNYVKNQFGDKITFTKNDIGYITKVQYFHDELLIKAVELEYDSNSYLSKVICKNGNTVISITALEFNESYIFVKDDLSGYRAKFILSSNHLVTSIVEGYDYDFKKGHRTTIEYADGYTTLTNSKGKKSYFFFDSDDMPSFDMDEEGNANVTEFDLDTKRIKSSSGPFYIKGLDNILASSDVSKFINNGVSISKVAEVDSKFENIISGNVYRVSGSGSLVKKISLHGLATDGIFALLVGKQLTPMTSESYVEVSLSCGGYAVGKFGKKRVDNQFAILTLGVNATNSFDEIVLTVKLVGNAEIELGGTIITDKEFASFYNYDDSGNTTGIQNAGAVTSLSYGKNNMPSQSIGVDSTAFEYRYDSNGNLINAITAYGSNIENTYDTIYTSNLICTRLMDVYKKRILETTKTYTSDGRFIACSTDELGNKTVYDQYDFLGNIKKLTNAMNVVSRFDHNDDGTLKKIILEKDTDSVNAQYEYDSNKRISKIILSNGSVYGFSYDILNNISEITLNGIIAFKYSYDLETGNLIKQTYGEQGDSYLFDYNEDGLITHVYFQPFNSEKVLSFIYLYDGCKRISKITDSGGKILEEYGYDVDGKRISIKTESSEIIDKYDNLNNVVMKSVETYKQKYHFSYDSISRSRGSNPSSVSEPFDYVGAYFGIFEHDGSLSCKLQNEKLLPIINHDFEKTELRTYRDGVIPCINVDSSNLVSYQLTNKSYYNAPCGSISFWFKSGTSISSSVRKYLFSLHTSYKGAHDFIGVYLMNKKIYLEVIDFNGTQHTLIVSEEEVDLNKWNFVSLNFMNRDDGQGYADICEYALVVNAHRQTFKKQDPRLSVDCDPDPVMNIGHKFDGKASSSVFTGKIAALMIGRRTHLANDIILRFYRLTKDYIIDNQFVDSETETVDFSQTNLFTLNQNILNLFDIYPLQNSVVSLDGKRPNRFEIRKLSELDKDRTFNFNSLIKRYAYIADGEELIYDFGFSDAGTIGMRVFTDVSENKQYLFELMDTNGKTLGLFRDGDKHLVIDVDGSTITTNLLLSTNSWHSLCFSFRNTTTSASQSSVYLEIRVILDGVFWETSQCVDFKYSETQVMIGRQYEDETISMVLGSYQTSYPLYGQIEMIATRPAFCESSTVTLLLNELKGLTKTSEYDDLGMLRKVDVHECGKTILSNTYEYKTRTEDSKFLSKLIKYEIIKYSNGKSFRSYEYDVLGHIKTINDDTFGNHKYEYDYRGFLVMADGESFVYDKNANLIKKGKTQLRYDSVIKDRLVSYGGTDIEYDSKNPLNPVKFGTFSFAYEGRRLIRVNYSGGYYTYTYNNRGLRVQKQDYRGVCWNYIYDDDKLITEISPNGRLDFLYDENGYLYGFIKNKDERYLYIRDALRNIIGITDISGKLIVVYKYDAWGSVTVSTIDSSHSEIGELNPFRYKGYYYDGETGMYYCKTRYYFPLWGRWLNADSPNNLALNDKCHLNLFAYCSNNPVSYCDDNGCFSWGEFWNGIKNFYANRFGIFYEIGTTIYSKSKDWFFGGEEVGENMTSVYGDDSKLISIYSSYSTSLSSSDQWWNFLKVRFGLKINLGDLHFSLDVGLMGVGASFGYKNGSVDFYEGFDRTGIGTSYQVNDLTSYHQWYINPTNILLTCAIVAFVPELIPIIIMAI